MKNLTALIATAAFVSLPSMAFAQSSTDALTSQVKDKAVDAVIDNMTTDDALTAGTTLLKGGTKEDAAMAVVKGRAEGKVESLTGTNVDLDNLSKDNMVATGKDIAMEKAKNSATQYGGETASSAVSYGDKAAGSAKTYSDKAAGSAKTYGDTAAGSHTTQSEPVIPKSGGTLTTPTVTQPAAAPINCPAGTKDAGDGTCMITGDWNF